MFSALVVFCCWMDSALLKGLLFGLEIDVGSCLFSLRLYSYSYNFFTDDPQTLLSSDALKRREKGAGILKVIATYNLCINKKSFT